MATSTEHYNFPKYEATDLPNLLDQYNNFADSADSTIYQQNTNIQSALTNSNSALSKANETAALVGTQTGTGTVFEQLAELNGGSTEFAPKVHNSTTGSTYGAASTAQYGHVRMASGFGDSGADVAMPISLGASLNSRVAELEEGGGGGAGGDYAPVNHASSATTYGVGSSSQYGHVKISDMYTTNAPSTALSVNGARDMYQELTGSIASMAGEWTDIGTLGFSTSGDPALVAPVSDSHAYAKNGVVIWNFHIHANGSIGSAYPQTLTAGTIPSQYRPNGSTVATMISSGSAYGATGDLAVLANGFVRANTDGSFSFRISGNNDYFGTIIWLYE